LPCQEIPMNILDAILLSVTTLLMVRGIFRGLILEIASLAGVLVGFLAATLGYSALGPWVEHTLALDPGASRLAAFGLLFVATVLALRGLAYLMRALLRLVHLGWLDRVAGGLLGLLKAGILASITVLVLTAFLPPQTEILATSRLVPLINAAHAHAVGLLPEDLQQRFAQGRKALDQLRTFPHNLKEFLP
jgi:membrane protein required for colicin V production